MVMRAVSFTLMLLFFAIPFVVAGPAFALEMGGFSGAGGGSGVICFNSAEVATQADSWLTQNKPLPESLLQQGELHVLEAWEMKFIKQTVITPRPRETWVELLAAVEGVLRADFPLFMYRLDQVGDWAKIQSWKDVKEIPSLEDAHPIVPIPKDLCRRVQIAVRYSAGNNKIDEGPPTHRPIVKVVFVRPYFDRLPEGEKAMLVFHEKIYMLAQSTGHNSSDRVRGFVRLFFDSDVDLKRGQPGQVLMDGGLAQIKESLILVFGDYLQFFSAQDPTPSAAPFTSRHHFDTYIALNRRLIDRSSSCRGKMDWKVCSDLVSNPMVLQDELTPEEAFVYRAHHEFERSRGLLNSDMIMDPLSRDPGFFRFAMSGFCSAMRQFSLASQVRTLVEKSILYCNQWEAAARTAGHSSAF